MENESISQWVDTESLRALAEDLMQPAPEGGDNQGEEFYGEGFVGFAESEAIPAPVPETPKEPEGERYPAVLRAEVPEMPSEVSVPPPPAASLVEKIPAPVRKAPEAPEVTLMPVARFKSPFKIAGPPAAAPLIAPDPVLASPVAPPPVKSNEPGAFPTPARSQPVPDRLAAFGKWLKEEYPAEAYFLCGRDGKVIVDEVGSEKLIKVAWTLAQASSNAEKQAGTSRNPPGLHVKVGADRVMEVIPQDSRFGLLTLGILVPGPLSQEAVKTVSEALGNALAEPGSAPRE